MKIIVNCKEKETEKESLSYRQVVGFAKNNLVARVNSIIWTVTYTKGIISHPEGSLTPNEIVPIKEGMRFNVAHTNDA